MDRGRHRFLAALEVAAGRPSSSICDAIHDAPKSHRYWAGDVPHHPTSAPIDDNHKVIVDVGLARDAALVVDLLTQDLETTARHHEAIALEGEDSNRRRTTRLPADGPGPGGATPGR